jgi:hypothetical protein
MLQHTFSWPRLGISAIIFSTVGVYIFFIYQLVHSAKSAGIITVLVYISFLKAFVS